jgi:hypothetical protein
MHTHYTILGQLSKILILNYNIVIYTNHHEFMSCHKGDEPLRLTKFSNLRESLPVSWANTIHDLVNIDEFDTQDLFWQSWKIFH